MLALARETVAEDQKALRAVGVAAVEYSCCVRSYSKKGDGMMILKALAKRAVEKKSSKSFSKHLKTSSGESKGVPSTKRETLELLEVEGTDREWHQLMMYAHVIELTRDVPGDIIEFGVASGTSLMAFVRMNDIFNKMRPHAIARKHVHGFDSFEGLPDLDDSIDLATKAAQKNADMTAGGFDSSETFSQLLAFAKSRKSCDLHKGWFSETVPKFLAENPHAAFSLIHIDCDLYSSTKDALEPTIERLSPGGVILFDEIFHQVFPGETSAFWEVYNKVCETVHLEIKRVQSMPWKWYAVRTY